MANENLSLVGAWSHSNGEGVELGNIGPKGNRFSGTFIGRTAYYANDFITNIYTDKDGALYVISGNICTDNGESTESTISVWGTSSRAISDTGEPSRAARSTSVSRSVSGDAPSTMLSVARSGSTTRSPW